MKCHIAQPDLFLTPKIRHIQVTNLSQCTPPAYTECRSRIGMHSNPKIEAQVLRNAAHAQALGNTCSDAVQFGLAR